MGIEAQFLEEAAWKLSSDTKIHAKRTKMQVTSVISRRMKKQQLLIAKAVT